MISLEHMRLLEEKIDFLLKKLSILQEKNSSLTKENENFRAEIDLLKEQCELFEENEGKIEKGILSVLNRLNTVEDSIRNVVIPEKNVEKVAPIYPKEVPTTTNTVVERQAVVEPAKVDTNTQNIQNTASSSPTNEELDIF